MTPTPIPPNEKVEPIVKVLVGLVVFLVLALMMMSKWSPNDGQLFTAINSIATTAAGALFMRVKPAASQPDSTPPRVTEIK